MATKRYKPEEIVGTLWQADILCDQVRTARLANTMCLP